MSEFNAQQFLAGAAAPAAPAAPAPTAPGVPITPPAVAVTPVIEPVPAPVVTPPPAVATSGYAQVVNPAPVPVPVAAPVLPATVYTPVPAAVYTPAYTPQGAPQVKQPADGKVYKSVNPNTRRESTTVTLTPEGKQNLLNNYALIQSPNIKVKIKLVMYSPDIVAAVQLKGGHSIGSAYLNFDDGTRQGGY